MSNKTCVCNISLPPFEEDRLRTVLFSVADVNVVVRVDWQLLELAVAWWDRSRYDSVASVDLLSLGGPADPSEDQRLT